MIVGDCEKCGNPVDDAYSGPSAAAYPVSGWEVSRNGGGTNAIRLRERTPNRVRHVECLPSGKEAQGTLL